MKRSQAEAAVGHFQFIHVQFDGSSIHFIIRLLNCRVCVTSASALFRMVARGCRPFSAEIEPLALSPGAPNPTLMKFPPLAVLRGSPSYTSFLFAPGALLLSARVYMAGQGRWQYRMTKPGPQYAVRVRKRW